MIVTFLLITADDNGATPKCVEKNKERKERKEPCCPKKKQKNKYTSAGLLE